MVPMIVFLDSPSFCKYKDPFSLVKDPSFVNDKTYFLKMNDIVYCEAEGSYTKFYVSNGEPILVSRNLRYYEELLEPASFFRTHHSCLVNPNKIKIYDRKTDCGTLILEGGYTVPVSQRKKDFVLALLEGRS